MNIALGGGNSWHSINYSKKAKERFLEAVKSDEYRQKMSIRMNSEEVKSRISKKIKHTMANPEWKERHSAIQKEVQNRQEERDRNRKAQQVAQNREEVKLKKSIKQRLAWKNDEFRSKHHAAITNRTLVNDGHTTKNIQKTDLISYLENGWEYGRLLKTPNSKKQKVIVKKDDNHLKVDHSQLLLFLTEGWELIGTKLKT